MNEKCLVLSCRNFRALVYLGRGICDRCWDRYAGNRELLRSKLALDGKGKKSNITLDPINRV
jgi:hypothetical protein